MFNLFSTSVASLSTVLLVWSGLAGAALTFKQTSNPHCYQIDPRANKCAINIRSIVATDNGSTAPILLGLQIAINGEVRFNETSFFENSIVYSQDLVPGGFKVACGAPNAGGGGAGLGNKYSVTVTPVDANQQSMGQDTAIVWCPAFIRHSK